MNAHETTCPPDRLWLDWATDRWLDMDPESPEASALLKEIFRENARQWLRRAPRRLRRRDVLQRRDPETLRTMIWLRNRAMLRARGVGSVEAPSKPITSLAEFCAEGERLGLTAADLVEPLSKRPEFADCLPGALGVRVDNEAQEESAPGREPVLVRYAGDGKYVPVTDGVTGTDDQPKR